MNQRYQEEKIRPLELIQNLDVEEIDDAIEKLNGEISALKSLRKVAAAKDGATGKPSSSGSAAKERAKSKEEKLNHAVSALERGSMKLDDLAVKCGCMPAHTRWFRKWISQDSRFSVDNEDFVVLS